MPLKSFEDQLLSAATDKRVISKKRSVIPSDLRPHVDAASAIKTVTPPLTSSEISVMVV